MQLSQEQKDAIRAEEHFRAEVRRELERGPPPTRLERIGAFFESRVGFWLLTTVLAGVAATGFTALQNHLDRVDIERRESEERLRRDTDVMLRLGPMLVSGKSSEVRFAIVLLDGLTRGNAVDRQIAQQISDLFSETVVAGTAPGASATERRTADAIIALAEQKPMLPTSEDAPAPTASAATGAALATLASKPLPVRVYIHIAEESDRPRADDARAAFHGQGMLVPGIERTGSKSAPTGNAQVRYCESKVDATEIDRVREIASGTLSEPPQMIALPEKLCGRVRQNHFELWFARADG